MNRIDYNLKWNEYFQTDESSPSGLLRVKNYRDKSIDGYAVGTKHFQKSGDALGWRLGFKGKLYLLHRIIWVMTYGSIDPLLVIDHLDGNPFNNKIGNLSLKTQKNNSRNRYQPRSNRTGTTGVSLVEKKGGHWYYQAQWTEITGKVNVKLFSIGKLGEETAKSMAITYREEQIQRLISEGADYTNRHGIIERLKDA